MAKANKKLIRQNFVVAVFKRDNDSCRMCGAKAVDAHHVTDRHEIPNGGYVPENGIALCAKCHEKAEVWHASGKTIWTPGYHPDDLYTVIGSDCVKALEASLALGGGPEK